MRQNSFTHTHKKLFCLPLDLIFPSLSWLHNARALHVDDKRKHTLEDRPQENTGKHNKQDGLYWLKKLVIWSKIRERSINVGKKETTLVYKSVALIYIWFLYLFIPFIIDITITFCNNFNIKLSVFVRKKMFLFKKSHDSVEKIYKLL